MFATTKQHLNVGAGLVLALVLSLFGLGPVAQAQTVCSNVSSGSWPAGTGTQACGTPAAANGGDMQSSLLSLNTSGADANGLQHYMPDAFARLAGFVGTTAGDALEIIVNNSLLDGGTETVGYPVVAGDSVVSVAAGLAKAFNSDSNLTSHGFFAFSNGAEVVFKVGSGTAAVLANSGATETITLTTDPSLSGYDDAAITSTVTGTAGTFYIFSTQTDFTNWPGDADVDTGLPLHLELGDFALTPRKPHSNPYGWTAIFDKNGNNVVDGYVKNTTVHEAGHQLDFLYANQGVLTSTVGVYASNSAEFENELTADFSYLNQSSSCTFLDGDYTPGYPMPGIFSYVKDHWGHQICGTGSPSSPYAGYPTYINGGVGAGDATTLNSDNNPDIGNTNYAAVCAGAPAGKGCNRAVLEAAFPDIFIGNNDEQERHEIFAEMFAGEMAEWAGFQDETDVWFGNLGSDSTGTNAAKDANGNTLVGGFACTAWVVYDLAYTGKAPTTGGIPAGGNTRNYPTVYVPCP